MDRHDDTVKMYSFTRKVEKKKEDYNQSDKSEV